MEELGTITPEYIRSLSDSLPPETSGCEKGEKLYIKILTRSVDLYTRASQ